MLQNQASPTLEDREALRLGAAFAYGYELTKREFNYRNHDSHQRIKLLEKEVRELGCFDTPDALKEPYFQAYEAGCEKYADDWRALMRRRGMKK